MLYVYVYTCTIGVATYRAMLKGGVYVLRMIGDVFRLISDVAKLIGDVFDVIGDVFGVIGDVFGR